MYVRRLASTTVIEAEDARLDARIDGIVLNGVPGPKGDTGDTGPIGPKGDPGVDGVDGQDGQDGARGPQGIQGVPGADGAAGGGLAAVVDDLTPQAGGDLDMAGHHIVGGDRKLLAFVQNPGARNFLEIENAPLGSSPTLRAGGWDNDVDLAIIAKRGGKIRLSSTTVIDGIIWPDVDGTAGQVLSTNGAGQALWVDQVAGGSLQAQIDALAARVTALEALHGAGGAGAAWADGTRWADGTGWVETP